MTNEFIKMTKLTDRKRNPLIKILYKVLYLLLSDLAYPVKNKMYEDIV